MKKKTPKDILRRRQEGKKGKEKTEKAKEHYPERAWWKRFRSGWNLVIALVTILGAPSAVLSLLPRVSIQRSGSIRPQDPMGSVFSLSNDSILPIHDLQVICGIDNIRNNQGGGMEGFAMELPDSKADILSPGRRFTIPCAHAVETTAGYGLESARIKISATYRPDFIPWHRKAEFVLEAEKSTDGTWVWKNVAN